MIYWNLTSHSIYSRALDARLEIDRTIGQLEGDEEGPCCIFIAGVHGNEPSGVFALHEVFQDLKKRGVPIRGSIYAFEGNQWALERGQRYQTIDLNRLWTSDQIERLRSSDFSPSNEDEVQQQELFHIIEELFKTKKGPFYFFDLHTTSSETRPFLTVNDSLLNRRFTKQYPAPIVLGIEEYLNGPLLSYINELGHVAFGFESGQHDAKASVENHMAFAYLSLVFTGAIGAENIDFKSTYHKLGQKRSDFYEIYFRHQIKKGEAFEMQSGFVNFQPIKKGRLLAKSDGEEVKAHHDSLVFMPLYQSQGEDGFFLIKRIPSFFLWLSRKVRQKRMDRLLAYLPGIQWESEQRDTLIVDLRVARFLARDFLHLFGYRSSEVDVNHLVIKNREAVSKFEDYQDEHWYRHPF